MTEPLQELEVTVTHGTVPTAARRYLAQKVAHVVSAAPAPVLHAEATVSVSANPACPRPVTAAAVLDVNGQPIRAHVDATEVREAADLLEERLGQLLDHLGERRLARRHVAPHPRPGGWRHGMLTERRPPFHPRPVEEREVVGRRPFVSHELTPAEAIEELDLLGHEFHLFTELGTGADALIERVGDGVRLTVANPPGATELPSPVPEMDLEEAMRTLEDGQLPRLFFLDRMTGRGAVLYHRYDGHYGLVGLHPDTVPTPTG